LILWFAHELTPFPKEREASAWCAKNGIVLQAFCPVARGFKQNDPILEQIAKEVGESWNRVLLRYSWQKG
jgi:diketogulonate reductase-like aldo/keto reductase